MLQRMLLFIMLASASFAGMYQSVPLEKAQLLQQGDAKLYCPNCGMHLAKFYKTSHAYTDPQGHTHQYCSLHCMVEAHPRSDLENAKVVDVNSLKFINARDAHYVIGSKKPGTMSMNSKYAFASAKDAKAFANENGGSIHNYQEALDIAYNDLQKDNMMVAKKRSQVAQKGEKMLKALCKTTLPDFHSYGDAKAYIANSGVCGKVDDQQAQAMAIALMQPHELAHIKGIDVPKDAKCPVCGMFVAKYPKWAAKMEISKEKIFYFDGVKDMMKYYFAHPAKSIIHVSDYYTLKAIDAHKAWYVKGSNVYGPMGNELIPFENEADAKTFNKEHFGSGVITFDAITPAIVEALDE